MQQLVFEIISVGRPHWEKGYVYALDACKILKEAGFLFHYLILGGCPDIELQYQIYDLELETHVTFLEENSVETIKSKIQCADLLLVTNIKRGVDDNILEGIRLETLVLTSDSGNVDGVISHGVNGFIVPIRSAKAIADGVIGIQSLPEEKKTDIKQEALKTLMSLKNDMK